MTLFGVIFGPGNCRRKVSPETVQLTKKKLLSPRKGLQIFDQSFSTKCGEKTSMTS